MIDCGEGTQRQLLKSGLGFKKMDKFLITHAHLDHILGLGGLLSTFVRWEGAIEQIEIWGGKPALDRIEALIYGVVLRNERPPIPIHLIDVKPGQLIATKQFTVEAFPVHHRGAGNFGYIFQEHHHRPFLADKAEAMGIPAGPERGRLVNGETVTLDDGRTITPEMVLGPEERGSKLVYIGDTGRIDNLIEPAYGADVLVIESTFLDSEVEEAAAFGHITARQAGILAREANVNSLLINHVSRRYRERDLIQEARETFSNAYVVRDFDHFALRRGQRAHKVENRTEDKQHDTIDDHPG